MVSEYRFRGIWRILEGIASTKLREADDELLAVLKAGIEAEFDEVDAE